MCHLAWLWLPLKSSPWYTLSLLSCLQRHIIPACLFPTKMTIANQQSASRLICGLKSAVEFQFPNGNERHSNLKANTCLLNIHHAAQYSGIHYSITCDLPRQFLISSSLHTSRHEIHNCITHPPFHAVLYLQSGGRGWAGWRRRLRSQNQTQWCGWSLRRRSRCSRWSTLKPGSGPGAHSSL